MELEDLKPIWHALDARLARQHSLQLEILRGQQQTQARRNLRPLLVGMALQGLLGIGLVLLGVACWRQNPDIPVLLATGIALHVFGVLHIAFAGMVTGIATSLDYSMPVLLIQKRLRLLLRVQMLNSDVCGLPWWIGWVLVVMAVIGLDPRRPAIPTPPWIWISLGVGVIGMLLTWAWSKRAASSPPTRRDDGADGIRRNLRLFDDVREFERE